MKEHNKNFEWKYVGYFCVILICLFGIVFLINLMIITKAPFKIAQDNDWIGFWGGILGAVLSGIITFLVLRITILNDQNKRKEDKRMEVYPYLSYRSVETVEFIKVDNEYKEKNNIIGEITTFMPVAIESDMKRLIDSEDGLELNTQIAFNVKNVGLGIAIEPKIVNIRYFGEVILPEIDYVLDTIAIGESAILYFHVMLPQEVASKKEIAELSLTIGYFNILKDYYEQDMRIIISLTADHQFNEDGSTKSISFVYGRNIIKEISEPKMIRVGGYHG